MEHFCMNGQALDRSKRQPAGDSAGLSAIELAMCVAVLLALAAIGGSYVWRARLQKNEAAAVASLRIINSAERVYYDTYNVGFSKALANLGPSAENRTSADAAGLLPADLASGKAHGYVFVYAALDSVITAASKEHPRKKIRPALYSVVARPVVPKMTGVRIYYTDESNVIRFSLTVAGPRSQPI